MVIKKDVDLGKISWLTTTSGQIDIFYEPETVTELIELCKRLHQQHEAFDLVGHTSNIYYVPGYHVGTMVSTRKINGFQEEKDCIVCECGASVKRLSHFMVNKGIRGFEGLVDLPGTIGAAIYGNAGCYGCSISGLLEKAEVLSEDGEIIEVGQDWFSFDERSSSLKRKEKNGIILRVYLKKEIGELDTLIKVANKNHETRKVTQPGPQNSLGSIFLDGAKPSFEGKILFFISNVYFKLLIWLRVNSSRIQEKVLSLQLFLLCANKLKPYLRTWNWWQWKDKDSHELFWEYVHLRNRLYSNSEFEIEIKKTN